MKSLRRSALLLGLPLMLIGCQNDGSLEESGETADEAIEETGQAVEEGADKQLENPGEGGA